MIPAKFLVKELQEMETSWPITKKIPTTARKAPGKEGGRPFYSGEKRRRRWSGPAKGNSSSPLRAPAADFSPSRPPGRERACKKQRGLRTRKDSGEEVCAKFLPCRPATRGATDKTARRSDKPPPRSSGLRPVPKGCGQTRSWCSREESRQNPARVFRSNLGRKVHWHRRESDSPGFSKGRPTLKSVYPFIVLKRQAKSH